MAFAVAPFSPQPLVSPSTSNLRSRYTTGLWDRVWIRGPSWPGTHCSSQLRLRLSTIPVSVSLMQLVQTHFQNTKLIYFYPFKSWIFCSNISFALTLLLSQLVTLSSSLWTIQSLQPPPYSGLLEMFSKMHFSLNLLIWCLWMLAIQAYGGQKSTCGSPLSPFTMANFGSGLRSSSLAKSSFICWAILPALELTLKKACRTHWFMSIYILLPSARAYY